MALPDFSMRQLLEAGVHFGHQTHRWNPKMDPFIFGKRNNIHILDLSQTVPLLHTALKQISDTVARGGRVLFVGTKRQASEPVADAARRSAQYYVNARWLGGMLTNWKTISNSIKRLRELEELLSGSDQSYTKKELLNLTREKDKLERALGGIKDMGGTPDMIFVIDTNKEAIAIQEARKLKIPVCAILDSNSDTAHVDFPIPGNDDAARAISLYCDLVAKAAIDGIARQQGASGVDLGAQSEAPRETVLDDVSATASDAAAAVSGAAADAGAAASDAGASVAGAASNAAGTAQDAISAAAASAAQMAGQAASSTANAASSAASSAADTASKAASSAANTASSAASSAADTASAAADSAAQAASDPAATASAAADKASSIASTVADAASSAVSGAAGLVSAVVSDVTTDAKVVADKAADAVTGSDKPEGPLFTAPAGEGDKLTDIKGIGPVAESQLKEQGITTFKQIAELTAEDIKRVDEYMPFSAAQIEDWQAQAKERV